MIDGNAQLRGLWERTLTLKLIDCSTRRIGDGEDHTTAVSDELLWGKNFKLGQFRGSPDAWLGQNEEDDEALLLGSTAGSGVVSTSGA
jgi:hypothetical protein